MSYYIYWVKKVENHYIEYRRWLAAYRTWTGNHPRGLLSRKQKEIYPRRTYMENFLGTGPQVSSILQALITLGSLSWSSRSDNTEKAG